MAVGKYTDAQRTCIESRDPRLVISAAAGTGKTFTLSEKIADAMRTGQIESIDQVLAITFTNKAASEIKSRVRSTLRAAGFHDQALLVDGAWISTIHGMCSRMLKAHALEVGIDPGFQIVEGTKADELLEQAIDMALEQEPELHRYTELFGDYAARGAGQNSGTTVGGLLERLIAAAKSSPLGFGSLYRGPAPTGIDDIAARLYRRLVESMSVYETSDCSTKGFKDGLVSRRSLADALWNFTESGSGSYEELAEILSDDEHKLKHMTAKNYPGIVEMFEDDVLEWQRACCELRGFRSNVLLDEAIAFAKEVKAQYDELKRTNGLLDNDDLMVLAYEALSKNQQIAEEYSNQFKLIMIDEFQDTSQLQIDIISLITSPQAQLCTVGDAQQSIYGFRGADVNVYDQFIEDSGTVPVKLETNFRSNRDILDFANKVFGQRRVFGKRFLRLDAGRPSSKDMDIEGPRVQVLDIQGAGKGKGNPGGVSADDRRAYCAASIADVFSRYRDDGCDPGDMVLLLGAMTNAGIYADALRSRGFEVVIAGGSGLWKSQECQMVVNIVKVLANPHDTQALYGLLTSGMVPIGTDGLVELVSSDDGRRKKLDRGMFDVDEGSLPELDLLRQLVDEAVERLDVQPVSRVVEQMLSDSGYFDRLRTLGAAGSSECANVLKAISYIEDCESSRGMGLSNISRELGSLMGSGAKDKPGVLMSGDSQAVRIMTIHASKGLEFPIVAVSEFTRRPSTSSFVAKSYKGKTYLKLKPGKSLAGYGNLNDAADAFSKRSGGEGRANVSGDAMADATDYAGYVKAVDAFYVSEDLGESKRCFYVAVTRASDALVVCMPDTLSKSGLARDSIEEDVCTALFGSQGEDRLAFPEEETPFHLEGGSTGLFVPLRIERDPYLGTVSCTNSDLALADAPPSPTPGSIPVISQGDEMVPMRRGVASANGMFSYSSISPHDIVADVLERGDDTQDYIGATLFSDEDSATELGLAFHATAEYMALSGLLGAGEVVKPDFARLCAITSGYALSDKQIDRYSDAVDRWASCGVSHRAAGYASIMAEVPFCMEFPAEGVDGGPFKINGEIDLLCYDESGEHAFIVDYKTGGSPDESMQKLEEKHRLQSLCYAYAVLTAGAEDVELVFVRIEQVAADGEPQTVVYRYSHDELPIIEEKVTGALASSSVVAKC